MHIAEGLYDQHVAIQNKRIALAQAKPPTANEQQVPSDSGELDQMPGEELQVRGPTPHPAANTPGGPPMQPQTPNVATQQSPGTEGAPALSSSAGMPNLPSYANVPNLPSYANMPNYANVPSYANMPSYAHMHGMQVLQPPHGMPGVTQMNTPLPPPPPPPFTGGIPSDLVGHGPRMGVSARLLPLLSNLPAPAIPPGNGLRQLVLWNNQLGQYSMASIARALVYSTLAHFDAHIFDARIFDTHIFDAHIFYGRIFYDPFLWPHLDSSFVFLRERTPCCILSSSATSFIKP